MPCTHRIEIAWRGEESEGDGGGLIPFAWMFLSEGKGFDLHTYIHIYIYKIIFLFFYR